MENELNNSEVQPTVRTRGTPASALTSSRKLAEEQQSFQEALRLKSAAESEARGWKDASGEKGHKLLKRKWSEASNSIRDALAEARQLAGKVDPSTSAVDEILENARLLEAAIGETRNLLRTVQSLPQVETGNNEVIARAYATTSAYLRATRGRFQEGTFASFISDIQQIRSLRIGELWALRPLMRLVLLEEIGQVTQRLLNRGERFEDAGREVDEQTFQVSTFVAALRALESAPWSVLLGQIGTVDHILCGDPCGAYPRMDFEGRNLYLQVIQQLAGSSKAEEPEIARRAIALARAALKEQTSNPRIRDRRSHVGFYLIGEGRASLERQIHFRASFAERVQRAALAWPEVYYFVGIELLTFAIITFLLIGARTSVSVIVGFMLLFFPAIEAAWGAMNQLTSFILPPRVLPKLDFSEGIPPDCATHGGGPNAAA